MELKRDYRQTYHANVPAAWANDPNGMIWYKGKAHLFCQYYPYKAQWGPMHWGHFVSEDLIRWEFLGTALAPDEDYETICGCCSGSSMEIDGRLWLMYTAAQPELQRQCLAWSDDGVHFYKHPKNPVLNSDMLHDVVSPRDFRDPKLFRKDEYYYCLAGIRAIDRELYNERVIATTSYKSDQETAFYQDIRNLNPSRGLSPEENPSVMEVLGGDDKAIGLGNLVLFRTKDLEEWEFLGVLLHKQPGFDDDFFNLKGVYECPDYFLLDGKEVILASPQNLPQQGTRFQNLHSVIYMTGKMDFENGHFELEAIEDLDSGFDVYASQTLAMPDGRRIMIAWKEMWDRSYPTEVHNWVGSYTLPRELYYHDGHLYQVPVREIEVYRQNKAELADLQLGSEVVSSESFYGRTLELELDFDMGDASKDSSAGVRLFKGKEHETVIQYDRKQGLVSFDRSRSGAVLTGKEEDVNVRYCQVGDCQNLSLRIFLDVSSVEVFINGGRYTMTGNVYPDPEDDGIEFFGSEGVVLTKAVKYDIVV